MKIDTKKLKMEASKLGIRMVILFGSQASGKARLDSDYDIAVLTTEEKNINKSMDNHNDVLNFMCQLFHVKEDKIDLTNLSSVSPYLGHEIALNSQLIYGNEIDFVSFKTFAMREYIATQDLRELEEKIIYKRQKLLANKIYA